MREVSQNDLIGGCPNSNANVAWASRPYTRGGMMANDLEGGARRRKGSKSKSKSKKSKSRSKKSKSKTGGARRRKASKSKSKSKKSKSRSKKSKSKTGGARKRKTSAKSKSKSRKSKSRSRKSKSKVGGARKRKASKSKSKSKKSKSRKSKSRSRRGGCDDHQINGGARKRKASKSKSKSKKSKSRKSRSRRGGCSNDHQINGGKRKRVAFSRKRTAKGGNFFGDIWNGIKKVASVAGPVLALAAGKNDQGDTQGLQKEQQLLKGEIKKKEKQVKTLINNVGNERKKFWMNDQGVPANDTRLKYQVAQEKKRMQLHINVDVLRAQRDTLDNWLNNGVRF